MGQDSRRDLEERTAKFGLDIIRMCKSITENTISRPLISQIVRSATSVGANYAEAQGASSKKDFSNKIYICRKEVQETRHWLKMLAGVSNDPNIRVLSDECHELIIIFQKISSTLRLNT